MTPFGLTIEMPEQVTLAWLQFLCSHLGLTSELSGQTLRVYRPDGYVVAVYPISPAI